MTIEFGGGDSVHLPKVGPVIRNEFAQVSVNFDTSGNSARLRLEDLRSGRVRYLDALELETIIWLSDERLTALLDPSAGRWRGDT
ncbi:hypothetical protein [Mycobacterium palustre]|uniref:Dihydrodiol dehydrogenase n=1 Tax=Mycobacterium palustre TaxID=153971 RepID=A0A1X1ZIQ4_9MYCO|nr:hypothetical protein [Mycobacterium palustre]MCV7102759.1 hypothetical protein [Mycobacterium palustre]ORW23254.1 hypothetical protein AWC19_11885 [Mycobacterium palustre]